MKNIYEFEKVLFEQLYNIVELIQIIGFKHVSSLNGKEQRFFYKNYFICISKYFEDEITLFRKIQHKDGHIYNSTSANNKGYYGSNEIYELGNTRVSILKATNEFIELLKTEFKTEIRKNKIKKVV